MTRDTIQASFPDMTEQDYQEMVARWLEINDIHESDRYYQAEVLPRSCYRMRISAPERASELLIVPVGTQPYAPLICCLGNPSDLTLLIMTEGSRTCADQVESCFQGERRFHKVLVSESDSGDIVRKVMASYDVFGQPQDVVCDVTGGTKIMTASLAGIAAVNGWRQVYVQSAQIRNKGSHSERIIAVSSVFEHLGGWHASQAWKLASVGQFAEAARLLGLAADQSVGSAQMRRDVKRFHLAQAFRDGDVKKVCHGVVSVARTHGVALPAATLHVVSQADHRGLQLWAARTLFEEGQKLAAVGLLSRLGVESDVAGLGHRLRDLERSHRAEWSLSAWKPIYTLLGRPYSAEAAARG